MSSKQKLRVDIVTAADGSATGYFPAMWGHISAIHYVKTSFDNGVSFAITGEDTGETIWAESAVNASAIRAPRQQVHSAAGVPALYAAGGSAVLDKITLAGDRVKVVIAGGGNAKVGSFYLILD